MAAILLPFYSVKTGSAGDSVAGTPAGSLGKYLSQTQVDQSLAEKYFDNVSGDENALGTAEVEYRCHFWKNTGDKTARNVRLVIGGVEAVAEADDDVFTATAHPLTDGMAVRLDTLLNTHTMPGGFNNSTTYYVRDATANTFKLAATAGGAAINVTSDGTIEVRKHFGTTKTIALDPTGVTDKNSASAQALEIANEDTAPDNGGPLTFSAPTTAGSGLAVADVPADDCFAYWTKRQGVNGLGAVANDGLTVKVVYDTDP